jgi:hypothetical protein
MGETLDWLLGRQEAREKAWRERRKREQARPLSERGVGRVPARLRVPKPAPIRLDVPTLEPTAKGRKSWYVAKRARTKGGRVVTHGGNVRPFSRPKALPSPLAMTTVRRPKP